MTSPDRSALDRSALDAVAGFVGARGERNVTLRPFTTFRIGGPADLLVRAQTIADLDLLKAAFDSIGSAAAGLDLLVIGQGSNLLVSDDGFRGVVIMLSGEFEEITIQPGADAEDPVVVSAGGAVKLPVLARRTVAAGLRGLEWMVGVPGSVGGGVRMNAGGHGSDVRANLGGVSLFSLRGDAAGLRRVDADALELGYRSSAVQTDEIVIGASFRLATDGGPGGARGGGPAKSAATGDAELREVVRWRREHQPGGANCGSVFTNPPGDSAGRLIDAAGLKGFRRGTASVSEKHANFIQADDGGSAADVLELIGDIRSRVLAAFGIDLHPEVRTAGFGPEAPSDPHAEPSDPHPIPSPRAST